jgi:flagellar basal-body rod modification protein FlgD
MSSASTLTSLLDTSAAAGYSTPLDKDSARELNDRFLKLLVAQMKNQDPLNPLDNAQVTSQMAQIQSVAGLEKLNTTVGGLNGHLVQLQALQGATLVGREVTLAGNRLAIGDGVGRGGFELSAAADLVKVEILNGAGRVVDQLDLGAVSAGRHAFEWPAVELSDADGYRFRVTASTGTTSVLKTTLMRDRVDAVASDGLTLNLDLQHAGTVAYDTVKAFN